MKKKNKKPGFYDISVYEQVNVLITFITFMFWLLYRGIIAFFLLVFMTEYFGVSFGRYGIFLSIGALCWTIYPIMKHKVTLRLI